MEDFIKEMEEAVITADNIFNHLPELKKRDIKEISARWKAVNGRIVEKIRLKENNS